MKASGRLLCLSAALLTCCAGYAGAADEKKPPTPGSVGAGASTSSVGAGGLTGSAATKDGARTGPADKSRPTGSAAPAAGTAR